MSVRSCFRAFLFLIDRRQKKIARAMMARTIIPPTTPPAIAPTGVLCCAGVGDVVFVVVDVAEELVVVAFESTFVTMPFLMNTPFP